MRVVPDDLKRRAARMLLGGATLLSEPCPYCRGVRVMKDGHALCTGCGREPEDRTIDAGADAAAGTTMDMTAAPRPEVVQSLKERLRDLTRQLTEEMDPGRRREILGLINAVMDTLDRMEQ